jgi:iron complex transport system ATP-binding protein
MVMGEAKELAGEGYTVIATTHNPEQSYMFSDRILALKGGRILCDGSPKEVLDAKLMQELYRVDVSVSSLFEDRVRVCTPEIILRP